MALPEESISMVEQWKKKSSEMSSASNDSIVSLLSRSIETISVVVNKKADNDRIQRALSILEYERSLSLQFDKIKNDEVRSLVYGHIECLHFALYELTKESNQVKECEEMFTQTDQELSQHFLGHSFLSEQVKESAEITTQTDQELSHPSLDKLLPSNDYADQSLDDQSMIPNFFELPKEEPFDETAIKIEDLWGDALEIKDEEMPNDNVEPNNANEDLVGNRGDVSDIMHNDDVAQSEMPALNNMGDELNFENEDVDDAMNDSKDNETMGEDKEKDSSETVEMEKMRSSRKTSKPVPLTDNESLDCSDDDSGPIIKKRKKELSKMKKRSSDTVEKKGGSLSSKGKSREMKCTECEYKTTSAGSFIQHLRYVHSTTLLLAGLALRCDCGVETVSRRHMYYDKCEIANFTVIRKRDGPIQRFEDEKTTPKCLLCDIYPTTAYGYIQHLSQHHNATLSAHEIWLLCECGAEYRSKKPLSNHTKECTRREYKLHKLADM